MAQLHYLISFDTETQKWSSADEALGAFFKDGYVWDGDEFGEQGEWRTLNMDDPKEVDMEYEGTEKVGLLLRKLNGME